MTQRTTQGNKFGSAAEAKTAAGAVKAKTESQTLVAENLGRVALYVTNDGANTAYLALGAKAVKSEGIRLNKEGGSVVVDNYTGVVSVVTAEGEPVITFSEI
jgi:hypothetical protein